MRLEDLAYDDLHQLALNEFDDDPESIARFNEAYRLQKADYIELLKERRAIREAAPK